MTGVELHPLHDALRECGEQLAEWLSEGWEVCSCLSK